MSTAIKKFKNFFQTESSGGIVLLVSAVLALLMANSALSEFYTSLLTLPVHFGVGDFSFNKNLLLLVNDGLMAIFFYLIGLEIKKELIDGELSNPAKASFSIFAAIGGMAVPALFYLMITTGTDVQKGWGIPMATDIAFALGILALLGSRIPTALKVFLLALAIVDDLGAILAIAFFYTTEVQGTALGLASLCLFLLFAFNKAGLRHLVVGLSLGALTWLFFLKSGVHATLAGVLLAFLTPSNEKGKEGTGLIEHYIHAIHPWSAFFIMPVFAFFNAGVSFEGMSLASLVEQPVSLGIIAGLVLGKPIGVFGVSFLATKLKLAEKPAEISWLQTALIGCLAGVGFTMSLFISSLAFGGSEVESYSKLGIMAASIVSGVIGYLGLKKSLCE